MKDIDPLFFAFGLASFFVVIGLYVISAPFMPPTNTFWVVAAWLVAWLLGWAVYKI